MKRLDTIILSHDVMACRRVCEPYFPQNFLNRTAHEKMSRHSRHMRCNKISKDLSSIYSLSHANGDIEIIMVGVRTQLAPESLHKRRNHELKALFWKQILQLNHFVDIKE